jgi:predicted nucleic acid-binding protein
VKARPLIDTGVLVGLLDARDEHHEWARTAIAAQRDGFCTCEAVVSELIFRIQASARAKGAVFAMIESGWLQVIPVLPQQRVAVARVLEAYHPTADYADACLVALHEQSGSPVWTTDRRDFSIYRTRAGKAVAVKLPDR